MSIKIRFIIIGAVIITIVHFAAIQVGLYEGKVWVDMPLHLAGGMLLGVFGIYITHRVRNRGQLVIQPEWTVSIVAIMFAMGGSFLWEILEFFLWKSLPQYANALKFYSSTVPDLLSDLSLGIAGGVIVAILYYLRSKWLRNDM